MGILLFLVLAGLIVLLVIRSRNDNGLRTKERPSPPVSLPKLQEKEASPKEASRFSFETAGLTPKQQSASTDRSPFDAGELTQQQKDQDDWDTREKLLRSDRFWSERQSVLLPVAIDYISAKGERSEREVDIRYFQLASTDDGQQTIHLDCFCHLRNARRYFFSHRAKSITVLDSGEIFTSPTDFRDFLFDYYAKTPEGHIDSFFANGGADIAEVALYLGRLEGKLKQRAKKVLLPVLSDLSGVNVEELKASAVCKSVFQFAGTEGKEYRAALKRLLASDSEETRAALKTLLENLSVDNKGKTDEVIAPLANKALKQLQK